MIPPSGFTSSTVVKNNPLRTSRIRFTGSAVIQKTSEGIELTQRIIELEQKIQIREKEAAIRAAKRKRRADRKARYYQNHAGIWENARNCHKAGYISPLPMYRRPLAFLSFDNLKHGWQRTEKLFKKQKGWDKAWAVFGISVDLFLVAVTHGLIVPWQILLPGLGGSVFTRKFIKAVQEHEADRLRK